MPKPVCTESLDLKYRARRFEDLVGQDEIVSILTGMFKSGKIARTIMLYGPSGCGKTTIARLVAQYANCTGEVLLCGKCATCKLDKIGKSWDVHEMNMAHATGIDNIRELQSHIEYLPQTNYRVYILDELHRCSDASKECLLKMLEEPPQHVIWILCTTELERFKDTVLGRCLKLKVKSVGVPDCVKLLQRVARAENSILGENVRVLTEIAHLVRGQPRDGLKALEKMIYYLQGRGVLDPKIITQTVKETIDAPSDVFIARYLLSIYMGKYATALSILKEVSNPEWFLREAIMYHTNLLYAFIKESLVTQFPPCLRLIEEVRRQKINLSVKVLSEILVDMAHTYSSIKSYVIDAQTLMIAMTCRLILCRNEPPPLPIKRKEFSEP